MTVVGECFGVRGYLIRQARKAREARESSKARIFEQAEAASIEMFSPKDNWDVTDYAVSFRWERVCDPSSETTTTKYQLQVADNQSFDSPAIDVYQKTPIDVEDGGEGMPLPAFDYWTEVMYMPTEVLSAGVWFWRVRVVDDPDEPWSRVVRFTVNNYHGKWPLVRDISNTKPLFIFDMYLGEHQEITDQWDVYYNFFPTEIQDYVAFAIDRNFIGFPVAIGGFDGHFEEFIKPLGKYNIPTFVKTGGPDIDFQVYSDLTELEHAFKKYPNILGITTGENLWAFLEASDNPDSKKRDKKILWLNRVIKLCNKYGRYVIFGEYNFEDFSMERYLGEEKPVEEDFEWMSPEVIHEGNLVFCPKTNTFWAHYHSDSIIFGA
ncbi:glycoside hydrolase family 98 domain-containing protein [Planctomycetota bacterium]